MQENLYIRRSARLLPDTHVSNVELAELLDRRSPPDVGLDDRKRCYTQAARTAAKTGIHRRHFFSPTCTPVELGVTIAERLLADDDCSKVDAVLFASSSVQGFPGVSQLLVSELRERHPELGQPFVLDVTSNACTNFLYALGLAATLMSSLRYRNVLCLSLELASRCIRYDVRSYGISSLFGDAGAGMLLTDSTGPTRLVHTRMGSRIGCETVTLIQGSGIFAVQPQEDVPAEQRWQVSGPKVALAAVELIADEIRYYRDHHLVFDWLLPHQANWRGIMVPACERAGIPLDRMLATIDFTGNTSSASVPFTYDYVREQGRLQPGDRVLCISFGASFSIASMLLEIIA